MVEMKKYKLSDLCDVFGRIGFRGYTVNDLVAKGEGAITFSPSDINNFTLSYDNCTYISLYKYEESPEIKVFNGNIIFTKTGSSIGKTAYVENLTEKATINPQFVVLKNFKCNGKYLFYILTSKWFQKSVWNIVVGSTVPTMSQEDFKKREVYLPERHIQDQVASALSTLDQRIENLRAQNRVLEQTAKTIYDYTFLQCAGHQTTYNKTLNRNIPAGWEVDNLYRIADFTNGLACQKYRPMTERDKLPVIKIREMHDGITADTEFVRSNIPEKVIVNPGDLLFSWSASLEVMMWNGVKGGLNQHIFKVTPKEYFSLYYVYFQLKDYIGNFKRMAEARKTTMGHITTDHLNQSRIAVPDEETMKRFSSRVTPLFKKQLVNSQQIETLTTQRNTLLPLLMTGQILVG